jgi:hypothetical protein
LMVFLRLSYMLISYINQILMMVLRNGTGERPELIGKMWQLFGTNVLPLGLSPILQQLDGGCPIAFLFLTLLWTIPSMAFIWSNTFELVPIYLNFQRAETILVVRRYMRPNSRN